jgi:hypothetical protein
VQFHPEASPGPTDTAWIFDEFISELASSERGRASSAVSRRPTGRESALRELGQTATSEKSGHRTK